MPAQRSTWDEMQAAVADARRSGVAVMSAVCEAPDPGAAGEALARLLGCHPYLAGQLLDVPLREFVASSKTAPHR